MENQAGKDTKSPSQLIDERIEELGNTRRAIDIHEGDKVDEEALKELILAAIALNKSSSKNY